MVDTRKKGGEKEGWQKAAGMTKTHGRAEKLKLTG